MLRMKTEVYIPVVQLPRSAMFTCCHFKTPKDAGRVQKIVKFHKQEFGLWTPEQKPELEIIIIIACSETGGEMTFLISQ